MDVHRLIELQAELAGLIIARLNVLGQRCQLRPGQEARRWRGIQADQAAKLRQPFAVQVTRRLGAKLGQQFSEHGVVIGGLERPGTDQPLAP
ncbi:hypothetical protein D3C84_1018540 [compost metagenome]